MITATVPLYLGIPKWRRPILPSQWM